VDIKALWDELETSLTPLLLEFRSRLDSLQVSQKPDHTLLTAADIAVQEHIVKRILAHDPGANIVAEEAQDQPGGTATSQRIWIIDPIDGTAEFVLPDRREYCSVVCLLENRQPVAALVVAPQIGVGGTAVSMRVVGRGSSIEVNGQPRPGISISAPLRASVTRSSAAAERPWEKLMADAGFELKTRTTSQTLDMVRTCVDLSQETGAAMAPFSLFYREAQKVWDGAAGMCLAQTAGLRVCDGHGQDRHVIDLDLRTVEPTFASTLVAAPAVADQFLAWSSG
jgi:3'(2'), 5'-bisphosphate nucleotidase